MFVPHLKNEINRLQKKRLHDKSKKGTAIENDAKNAKCENSGCQWVNVTLKNVEAYGQCLNCNGYEHHHCAGTSKMMKDEIKLGRANFICTTCMENNPALAKELTTSKKVVAIREMVEVVSEEDGIDEVEKVENIEIRALVHVDAEENDPTARAINLVENSVQETETSGRKFDCTECDHTCGTENELISHVEKQHAVEMCPPQSCQTCDQTFANKKELEEHSKSHTGTKYNCELCDYETGDKDLLKTHTDFIHVKKIECITCKNTFNTEHELEDHIKLHERVARAFQCNFCVHTAMTREDLEKHIHDEHDTSNRLDDTVDVDDKTEYSEHCIGDKEAMSRKLKLIEDSYDRLMALFKKKQSEYDEKALAFKEELEEINEKLRVITTENEKLKEVNETQHKLWKIFVENEENRKTGNMVGDTSRQEVSKQAPTINDIEILEDDEEPEEIQTEAAYQEWLKDLRGRGFKRSNPASPAERIVSNGKPKKSYLEAAMTGSRNVRPPTLGQHSCPPAGPPPSSSTSPPCPPSPTTHQRSGPENRNNIRYCHNWNNLGRCDYDNCKFTHENAPVCNFDGTCRRKKCMFSHKKQNMHFLSQNYKPPLNPWSTMPAPWQNPFAYQINPWQNPPQSIYQRNKN